MLAASDIDDVPAEFVADPFLLRSMDTFFLFFEVWNRQKQRGEVGLATSPDGIRWSYQCIVLSEDFHLSYPHVFEDCGTFYLIPESRFAGSIRLYRAVDFPHRWIFVADLVRGPFVDSSLLRYNRQFWLITHNKRDRALYVFSSRKLKGPWTIHPSSPLFAGNSQTSRNGGRIIGAHGRLLRFAQDGEPTYGHSVRVLEIEELSESTYREREIDESPILTASGIGWNATAMHHADLYHVKPGWWIAAVDGAADTFPGDEVT